MVLCKNDLDLWNYYSTKIILYGYLMRINLHNKNSSLFTKLY